MHGADAWLAVLARDPRRAKTRLAPILDAAGRADLAVAMLEDVLRIGAAVPFARRLVVTESARVGAIARGAGYERLDAPPSGTNGAARVALATAAAAGAARMLVLAADLPLLEGTDLEAMLAAATTHAVVIAPDRRSEGTNALLLSPPLVIEPAFGPRSCAEHVARARRAGAALVTVERDGLAHDVDEHADLALLEERIDPSGRTAVALARLASASTTHVGAP